LASFNNSPKIESSTSPQLWGGQQDHGPADFPLTLTHGVENAKGWCALPDIAQLSLTHLFPLGVRYEFSNIDPIINSTGGSLPVTLVSNIIPVPSDMLKFGFEIIPR